MKFSPLIILLLAQFAIAADADIPGSNGARHMILPYVGYQTLDGEEIGYDYSYQYYDDIFNGFHNVDTSGTLERNTNAAVLGLLYRYTPSSLYYGEFSLYTIHDGKNLDHNIRYILDYGGFNYTQRTTVEVTRSHTKVAEMNFALTPPTSLNWLTIAIRIGGGYAWREIKHTSKFENEVVSIPDSDAMYVIKGGLNLTVWSKKNFIIEGSMFYSNFFDVDGNNDPFGGLGWRVSLFPIWSFGR